MHMGVICFSFLASFHCGRQNASQDSVRAKSTDPETNLIGFLLQRNSMDTSSSSFHIYSTYWPNPISLLLVLLLVSQLLNQIVQDDKWREKKPIKWQVWLDFFSNDTPRNLLLLLVVPTAPLVPPFRLLLLVNHLVSHQFNNVVRCRQW